METWNKERLSRLVREQMGGMKFIAVSNREPYIHVRRDRRVECLCPASGVTSAIDPILRASGGVWVAHGSGAADREVVDRHDRVAVPPEAPSYTLRRVWLPDDVEREYYCGLANEGLWPLCHVAFHRPAFRPQDWKSYREANELFARAVLDEAGGQPAVVFIQDYHFGLLPLMLKRANPGLVVAQFWHIPWPNSEMFRTFPWRQELLEGMLANDLLGFHVPAHCSNFLETVECTLEATVDGDGAVTRGGHTTRVQSFPIGVDFEEHCRAAAAPEIAAATALWRQELGDMPELLGIGIDRVDYTKGIPERLRALEALFEERPEYVGRLTFLQVAVPSRTAIGDYDRLNGELTEQVERINRRWGRGKWRPVVLVHRHVNHRALVALHLMADFCLVSSLHDGMNLVAKEFAASRVDADGVLILSAFAGAAEELTDALIVNPFAVDEMAEAIHTALSMPAAERRRRMNRMRAVLSRQNIYCWAGSIVSSLARVEAAPSEAFVLAGAA